MGARRRRGLHVARTRHKAGAACISAAPPSPARQYLAASASPLRSLLWSGPETVGTVLIGFLSVIVIARLIGPAEFGLAAIGLGLTLVVIVFISSLVHDGLVRSADYSELQLDSAFTFSLLAGAAGAAGLALMAWPLARLLDEPGLVPVLLALLPMVPLGALAMPLIAERRRMLDFRTIGRHQLLSRSIGLGVGIALASGGGGVWSVVIQQLTTSGLLMLTLTVKRRRLPRLRLDWRSLQPILQFSKYITLTGLVVQLTERLFLTLVGFLYGLNAAGKWAVASRLVENITVVLTQSDLPCGAGPHGTVSRRPSQAGPDRHDQPGHAHPRRIARSRRRGRGNRATGGAALRRRLG